MVSIGWSKSVIASRSNPFIVSPGYFPSLLSLSSWALSYLADAQLRESFGRLQGIFTPGAARSQPYQRASMRTPVEISAKILLAEDDNDMRRFLVKALQNAGYSVASFDNGMSAYNRLREEPFELLLTDIVMPEMDGIELARRATELDPEIKVMFITGFAAVALNPDNSAPKDARILSKPFHLRDLVNEVERLLNAA